MPEIIKKKHIKIKQKIKLFKNNPLYTLIIHSMFEKKMCIG